MVLVSRLVRTVACISITVMFVAVFTPNSSAEPSASTEFLKVPFKISVKGNVLIDGYGQPVRLVGVNKSGSEYMCANDWNFFDGKANAATVKAMKSWKINVVRVPLNESCWLGINGVGPKFSGINYKNAINNWVMLLQSAGIYAILDLHVSAAGATKATRMANMANEDHSIDFWRSVATFFKSNQGLIFDLTK